MIFSQVNSFMTRQSNPFRILQSVAAILLLQVNLASAVAQSPAPQVAQPAPEAPAPAAGGQPATPSLAQQARQQAIAPQQPFNVELPHSRKPFAPYRPSDAPPLDLNNSPRLQSLIRDGKLYISLNDAIALAIENNLDLAYFRYNFPIAQTDLARTKAGSHVNGVNTEVVQSSTQGGFGFRGSEPEARAGSSAAGVGRHRDLDPRRRNSVPSFDPFLTFKGFVDHTVIQEANASQVGVAIFKKNRSRARQTTPSRFPSERTSTSTTSASALPITAPTTLSIPCCIRA